MPKTNIPSYRLHKASGQAVVCLNSKMLYLGKYKSKASKEKYDEIISEYLANGKKLPPTRQNNEITIQELAVRFLEWAGNYYGDKTPTFGHCRLAVTPLVQHYGKNTVSDFGPLSLVFLRDKWVESGKARKSINRYTAIIRQAVKWGVSRELVPAAVWHALQSVENLKAGRTSAKEYRIIQPINEETVLKTIPFMPPIIADMVRIQLLIGGRPQDVCNMRSCDIDRSEDVWRYRPFRHKTKYKSKTAERAVGPKAQAVLAPYLERKAYTPEAFLFSPQDTVKLQKEEKRRKRKTKVQPSQINRSKPNPSRPPKENYTKDGYGRAVRRACVKAGVEIWSPNRLRHSAGSKVREKYGLEYAQAVLGHANAKTTEIYAEVSFGKAAKVAREMG